MSLSLLAGKKSFEIKLGKDVNLMEFNHDLRPRQRNLKDASIWKRIKFFRPNTKSSSLKSIFEKLDGLD